MQLGVQPADGGKFVCGVNTFLQHSSCVALSFGSNVRNRVLVYVPRGLCLQQLIPWSLYFPSTWKCSDSDGSRTDGFLQGETSFEEDVLNRTPCEVHTFDPTLDSGKRALVERVPAIHLHEYGLGAEDSHATFGDFDAEIKTLPTILGTLLFPFRQQGALYHKAALNAAPKEAGT